MSDIPWSEATDSVLEEWVVFPEDLQLVFRTSPRRSQ
jgi:hypothetical protein